MAAVNGSSLWGDHLGRGSVRREGYIHNPWLTEGLYGEGYAEPIEGRGYGVEDIVSTNAVQVDHDRIMRERVASGDAPRQIRHSDPDAWADMGWYQDSFAIGILDRAAAAVSGAVRRCSCTSADYSRQMDAQIAETAPTVRHMPAQDMLTRYTNPAPMPTYVGDQIGFQVGDWVRVGESVCRVTEVRTNGQVFFRECDTAEYAHIAPPAMRQIHGDGRYNPNHFLSVNPMRFRR